MASIALMNRILRINPNLMVKAVSNEGIITGAISKVVVETCLLRAEFATYAMLFGSQSFILLNMSEPSFALLPSLLITAGSTAAYVTAPLIAGVRTCSSIRDKTIHIMQLQ